ncbi:MAG TPA: ACT domain-containing protein [Pyrinomonadaceae bacterium]
MIILDKPTAFDGLNIPIPLYHRGHLSLFPGAKVWLCVLPKEQEGEFSEMIVSPIPQEAWNDLWRISITLRERVGVVNDVFGILAELGFNVITAESTTNDYQRLHSVEIIADARLYSSPFQDGSNVSRTSGHLEELDNLQVELLSRLIDHIALLPSGRPRLRIRRVRNLLNASREYSKALNESNLRGLTKPTIRESTVKRGDHRSVMIPIPKEIRNSLLGAFSKEGKHREKIAQYLLVSNTSERFLHIYFIRESDCIVAPTIEHQDEIGALAEITSALKDADFNILTTLSRLYRWESQAHTEFVLQPSSSMRKRLSESAIKRRLEEALASTDPKYKIKVGYFPNYRVPLQTKEVSYRKFETRTDIKIPYESREQATVSTVTLLNRKFRELSKRIQRREWGSDDYARYELAQDLLDQQRQITTASLPKTFRSLFISHTFKDPDILKRIKQFGEKEHFSIIFAKDLEGATSNREGIIDLLIACRYFLGIWSERGGQKVTGGYLPSPWLYWEWGAANALGLNWRLLISSKIHEDSWKRIAAETPHSFFASDLDLLDKLKTAMHSLSQDREN